MAYYVYIHTNKTNGKMYVGITSRKLSTRWGRNGEGYHTGYFARAIQKYGWDGFTHEYWEVESEEAMKQCERDLIAFFNTNNDEYGYNLTEGGDGTLGFHHSEESKQKSSESNKEFWCTDEARSQHSEYMKDFFSTDEGKAVAQKISVSLTGRHPSAETRAKLSTSHKGHTPWNKGKKCPSISESRKGIVFSDTHIQHLSESNKGKHQSEESNRKRSESLKGKMAGEKHPMFGKHQSEESNRKRSESLKGKSVSKGNKGMKWMLGPDGKRIYYTPEQ